MVYAKQLALITVITSGIGVTACGSASPTDKSADGARAALLDYVSLVKDGKAKEACDKYVTEATQQQLAMIGSCETVLAGTMASSPISEEKIKSLKFTVNGDKATYKTGEDSGEFTYIDGSWKIAADGEGSN